MDFGGQVRLFSNIKLHIKFQHKSGWVLLSGAFTACLGGTKGLKLNFNNSTILETKTCFMSFTFFYIYFFTFASIIFIFSYQLNDVTGKLLHLHTMGLTQD